MFYLRRLRRTTPPPIDVRFSTTWSRGGWVSFNQSNLLHGWRSIRSQSKPLSRSSTTQLISSTHSGSLGVWMVSKLPTWRLCSASRWLMVLFSCWWHRRMKVRPPCWGSYLPPTWMLMCRHSLNSYSGA